jgi:phage terminase small subunit
MPKVKDLTFKQKQFCEQYVIDWNGARAYRHVYPNVSEQTSRVNASKLLTNTNILHYIDEVQKDLARLCGISATRNLLELKKIAYSSIHNYKSNWMTLKEWDEISEDDKAAISSIDYIEKNMDFGTETVVKFKLYDKQKAIEAINKMLGLNAADKIDHTVTEILTPEDRNKRIEMLKSKIGR